MFGQNNSTNGRSIALDALRGFALFGVLIANIFLFNSYNGKLQIYFNTFPGELNQITGIVVQYLFRGRFYPIFAFLFGLGIGIQFIKQRTTGASIKLLARRLLILLLIGVSHYVLIWDGDILIRYSLVGIFALAFINLPKNYILAIAVATYAFHSLYTLHFSSSTAQSAAAKAPILYLDYMQLLVYRIKSLPHSYGTTESFFYSVKVLTFVLFGLFFSKSDAVQNNSEVNWLRVSVVLVFTRLTTALLVFTNLGAESNVYLSFLNYLLNPSIYVAAFMYLANTGILHKLVSLLSSVGRMSLTNYLLQNIVLAFIFYGYGLGKYQEWQPWQLVVFSALLFLVQGYLSQWWLHRFSQGPVEKLWRHFTYEKSKRKAQLK